MAQGHPHHDTAKFLAGIFLAAFVYHVSFAYSKVLPLTLHGIEFSQHTNMIVMAASGILAVFFIWYGWMKK